MSGKEFATVDDSTLTIVTGGVEKVFAAPVSLKNGTAFQVDFTLDCPAETSGGALCIDLFAPDYDNPENEFSVPFSAGKNKVSGMLPFGGTHPQNCQLRIFTLDNVNAVISDINISLTEPYHGPTPPVVTCIAVLIVFAIIEVFLVTGFVHRQKRLQEPSTQNGKLVEQFYVTEDQNTSDFAPTASERRIHAFRDAVFILVIVAMTIFLFRDLLIPGNMIGDRLDARLDNIITEHWFKVFCGNEKYSDFAMLYPVSNTVSYVDMLFDYAIPYSVLRFLGFNMFQSFKYTLISLHLLGSFSLYFLFRKVLKLQDVCALTGVTAFSFAAVWPNKMGHVQLLSICYYPLILIFLILALQNFENSKKRRLYLFFFLTLYASQVYTGWYMFYFSAIFLMLCCAVFIIYCFQKNKSILSIIWVQIKRNTVELICWFVYFFLLLTPFLNMMIPTLKTYGGRNWGELVFYSPEFIDIFNVGSNNLILGKLIQMINFAAYRSRGEFELAEGFSIILLIALCVLIRKFVKERENLTVNDTYLSVAYIKQLILSSLIIGIGVSLIMPVNSGGVSLWWFIYKFLPGASSVRVVARYYFFLILPMSILLAILLDRYPPRKHTRSMLVCFTVLLWVSNISISGVSAWNYHSELALLESVASPPQEAEVFALYDSSGVKQPEYGDKYANQLDAAMIADYYGLKTVNGQTGFFPEGWNLHDITQDNYLAEVASWKLLNGFDEDVYIYDRATNIWSLLEHPGIHLKEVYRFNSESDSWFVPLGDWHASEDWGRWTGAQFSMHFEVKDEIQNDLEISLTAHTFFENKYVNVFAGDKLLTELLMLPESNVYSFTVPKECIENKMLNLRFEVIEGTLAPVDVTADNQDTRGLAIGMLEFSVSQHK